jgi:SnoaL-like domain
MRLAVTLSVAFGFSSIQVYSGRHTGWVERNPMPTYTRDELVARLVRAGELEVSGEHPDEVSDYFDTEQFVFQGPDGLKSDYDGLSEYFGALRAAFDDRRIERGIVLVEGSRIACQTRIEGTFVRPFSHSPVGLLEPNGARIAWDLINIFEYDDEGRMVREFVQTDNRSTLSLLGAPGA